MSKRLIRRILRFRCAWCSCKTRSLRKFRIPICLWFCDGCWVSVAQGEDIGPPVSFGSRADT